MSSIEHLQVTGAALWLVGGGALSDDPRAILAGWVADVHGPTEFLAAWADRPTLLRQPGHPRTPGAEDSSPTVSATVSADDPWPYQLPDDDFTTFRAACRALLTRDQFAAVDAHLPRTARDAATWLADHLSRDTARNEEALARRLHAAWRDSPTTAHFLTAVRAHQVAAFAAGWHLQVDVDQLLGAASVSPRRAARTPALWRRLSRYASQHRGAICAMTAAGSDLTDQGSVLVESVTDAGRTVTLPTGRRVRIEDGAHHHLHAQQLSRLLQGAAGDEPLPTDPDGCPLRERALADALTTAQLELGINLTGPRAGRRTPAGDRWLTRWGLSIQEIA